MQERTINNNNKNNHEMIKNKCQTKHVPVKAVTQIYSYVVIHKDIFMDYVILLKTDIKLSKKYVVKNSFNRNISR